MRMWNIEVENMCNQHLLGEHVEMHMFAGTIKKGISIKGYIDNGLVETHNIRRRHAEIAGELKRRGMNHKSPIISFKIKKSGNVDIKSNKIELTKRCKDCRARFKK